MACAIAMQESRPEAKLEAAWQALDSFKSAVMAAKERDLEGEAVALSRQASVFSELLSEDVRARPLFLSSITLAAACAPRSFHGQKWYDTAVAFMQRVREAEERAADEATLKEEATLLAGRKECDKICGGRILLWLVFLAHHAKAVIYFTILRIFP